MTLIFWIVPVLSVVSNLSIYGYALGMDVNMKVIVSILMGGIFILLGNYMSKNHQNYTVGIKLPWTLNSEENWNRTHRMAGKLWILAGLVFWGSVFFENNTVPIVIIVVVVTIPMIYSFVLYKRESEKESDRNFALLFITIPFIIKRYEIKEKENYGTENSSSCGRKRNQRI